MAERSRAVVSFSLCCFLLHLNNLGHGVGAQNPNIDIVIAHPGQDIELQCNVTSRMVSWAINNEGKYSLSELSSGKVRGYSSSGNSLIVKDIMMNDPRDAYVYGCWIQSTNTTTRFTLNNQFLLYVAGISTFSVVATNSVGSGEAGVVIITTPPGHVIPTTITTIAPTIQPTITSTNVPVATSESTITSRTMITTPPAHIDTSDDVDDDDVDNEDNLLLTVVIVIVVVVIICSCGCMHILFCYFCKRKERDCQHKDKDKHYRIVHVSIIVLGIFTCGTSVLLWWLYKNLAKCTDKDKYDVEDQSTNSKKSSKNLKGLSVSNGLTEHDKSENKTVTSPNEEPYAVSTKALSEGSFIEPLLHYDYASLGARKIVGIHQTAANGAQQAISTKIENPDTTANGVQYAVCNIVPAKDVKGKKEVKTDTQHQQPMEYAVVDKNKKKKKKGDKQQNKINTQQQQQQGAMEYAVVDNSKKKKVDKQRNGNMGIQQSQLGEEIKEEKYANHNQKTELNYMSPSNLEFKEVSGNRMHMFDVDHNVQYQEVVTEKQKYTSIL